MKLNNSIEFLKLIYSYKFNKIRTPLKTLHMDVSNACNLNCEMCEWTYLRGETNSFPDLNVLKKRIDEAKKLGLKHVIIGSCSEPLLYSKIEELVDYLKNKNIKIEINTNLSFPYKISKRLKNIDHLIVSIDAPDEETYKKIRIGGNFNQIINNIKKLKKYNLKIQLSYVIQRNNYNKIVDFVNLAKKLKVDSICLGSLVHLKEDIYNRVKLNQKQFQDLQKELKNAKILADKLKLNHNLNQKFDIRFITNPVYPCYTTYFSLFIKSNGDVFPCCISIADKNLKIGNIYKESLKKIWLGEKFQKMRNILKKESKPYVCQRCVGENFNKKIYKYAKYFI